MTNVCRPFRIKTNDLADIIYKRLSKKKRKISKSAVYKVLTDQNSEPNGLSLVDYKLLGVSSPYDKVTPLEVKKGLSGPTSTSQAEVMRFVYQVARFGKIRRRKDTKAVIARELYNYFFGRHKLYEDIRRGTPNGIEPHEETSIKFYGNCIDGDTCRIKVWIPKECYYQGLLGFYGYARESQIDSAEISYRNVDYFIPESGKDWTLNKLLNPDYNGKTPRGVKYKFVENCTKIFREIVLDNNKNKPINKVEFFKKFSRDEVFKAVRLIAAWHDYAAKLDTAIMNGFVAYAQDRHGERIFTRETTIRFSSKDIPKSVCGIWQPYDRYLRRIAVYLTKRPEVIHNYLGLEFLKNLKSMSAVYYKQKQIVSRLSFDLKRSKNPKIRMLAKKLDDTKLRSPVDIYKSHLEIRHKIREFLHLYPGQRNNWSLVRVLLGSTVDYQKYRSQEYPAFGRAGKLARKWGHGLWGSDPTFRALWIYNSRNPRYRPKDCLTGRD